MPPDVDSTKLGLTQPDRPIRVDDRPLVTIIIPAFNEEMKLASSLATIHAFLVQRSSKWDFEILVIDDGSTDDTFRIAHAFAVDHPEVLLLRQPVNMGLGQALRDGFAASNGDVVVAFDSDLSYSVDHIERLVDEQLDTSADMVVASPYMDGGRTTAIPWRRAQMSRQVNRLLAWSSQYQIATITSMVRAYDGAFIRGLSLKSMGPEINTEIIYKAQILRAWVIEIPAHLDWSDQADRMASRKVSFRVSTTSKLLVFASFLFRPIFVFALPGAILLTIALLFSVSLASTVLSEADGLNWAALRGGLGQAWELRPHTLVVTGFTLVIAVQLISLGLLASQAKRYFEELFYSTFGHRRNVKVPSRPALEAPLDAESDVRSGDHPPLDTVERRHTT